MTKNVELISAHYFIKFVDENHLTIASYNCILKLHHEIALSKKCTWKSVFDCKDYNADVVDPISLSFGQDPQSWPKNAFLPSF